MLKPFKCVVGMVMVLALVAGPSWADSPVDDTAAREEASVSGEMQAPLSAAIKMLKSGQGENSATAVRDLQRVVELGSPKARAEALLWLGRAYRDGLAGTEKDSDMAFNCFERSAGRGGLNPEAQYELGRAYLNGEGTDRNLIAAYIWTELSLHTPSGILAAAKAQKARLLTLLNELQLEKAKELVGQLATLYL